MTRSLILAALCAVLSSRPSPASDFDIVINEICYNPQSGDDRDEFIELYNRGPSAVALGGWAFTEGIRFTFRDSVSLGPNQYLVVSPDAARTRIRLGIQAVVGDWAGKLDNGGEILTLADSRGAIMSRVHYEDGVTWPSNPDGLGPTLELVTPHEQNDLPQKWASSLFLDGTPGRRNSRFVPPQAARAIVSSEDLFRTWKGTADPSSPPGRWTERGFADGAWPQEQGPFGYGGSYPANTVLDDMQGPGGYLTYYIRRTFDIDPTTLADLQAGVLALTLHVSYDDAFVVYLNSSEVGRANVGQAGTPVPRDASADNRIDNGSISLNLGQAVSLLVEGGNVLAIQGVNQGLASGDFFLGAELILSSGALNVEETPRTVVLNEVRPAEGAGGNGFIELHNSTASAVSVAGWWVVDSRGARFRIPAGPPLPPGGFLLLGEGQLGFPPALSGATYTLLGADGVTWVDGLDPGPGPPGVQGLSSGRFPDGNEDQFLMRGPTPGAPNQVVLETAVVVNEVLFHPPFVAPSGDCSRQCSDPDQWIELHNHGQRDVPLGGWSLSKAVDFSFTLPDGTPDGSMIPAGGYLVIAADRARFLARYPGVDPGLVKGGWTSSLGRDSDTLNLRDALGNRVDHVKYGDGSPLNDEAPLDGVDDRTLASSEWTAEADDGRGATLELVNPRLDNRPGAAWAPGPPGGTPAAPNASLDLTPPPVVWDVENAPAAPRSSEPVRIACRVSSVAALSRVEALWRLEPAGGPAGGENTLALLDNGLSGDGTAGDGVFGGSIAPQPAGSVISFRVRAQAQDGQTTLAPRSPAAPPYAGFQGVSYLYQVDNAPPPQNGSVTYRVVMTPADLNELRGRPVSSNVLLPCTFIGDGKAHHAAGIRIRGESSRQGTRKAWRIDLPPERRFRGLEHVNLISTQIQNEILASDLFRRAGLPYMQEWTVNLLFQGSLDPLYVLKENMDGDFLDRFFGGSAGGNLYRAMDPLPAGGQPQGDLTYYGEDPEDLTVYREVYDKKSNREEDDYSDIIALCRAFNPAQTSDAVFPETIEGLIDVEEWARFLAVQACLSNADGGIQNSSGEDYLLYRVPESSTRPDHGKWLLVPWDLDETFTNSAERLFRPDIPAIRRFLTHPEFAPLYYASLLELRDGAFARFETRQRFYLIDDLFGFGTIDGIDSYITARIGFIDQNIPVVLGAGVTAAPGTVLVRVGDVFRYWKGTAEPSGGSRSWAARGFDDSGWLEGPTGFGYGDGDDATVLPDMQDAYTTVYVRRTFTVAEPALIGSLELRIDYDDGFVAYLNGQEVARRNAPGNPDSFVPFDATASANREAGTAQAIDLFAFRGLLVEGPNALAFQALNGDVASTDLSLIPELATGAGPAQGGGCGSVLFATASPVTLSGRSNAALTAEVRVNGSPAAFDPFTARWTAPAAVDPGVNLLRVEAFDRTGRSIDTMELTVHRLARPLTAAGGTLTASTSFTEAGGPYLMTQDVVVPAGVKLTIEPGTVVLGQAGASILVRGHLEALGTREDPIVFRAFSCQNRMGGIAFDNTGIAPDSPLHRLRFCDIEFGNNPAGFGGTVAPVGSKLLVEDCTFRELAANAVDGINARLEVRRSLFERIQEGVHCNSSLVIVVDCTFSHMIGDKDAIDFDLNGPGAERSLIERNLMEYSSDDGIDLQATTVDVRDNIFRYIQDKAMSLEENGPLGGPTVTGNLVHDSGTALALKSGVVVSEGHHNTLVGNQEGVNIFAKAGAPDGGHGAFHSMIIWDNIYDVKLDARSTVSFTHSLIGLPWPGAGNLTSDPRFVDLLRKDFSLAPGSPAIASGKDGTEMGAIPFNGGGTRFIRGDADSSAAVNLSDAILVLEHLFRGRAGPACMDRLDANDDAGIDISDPIFILFFLFAEGSAPWPPYPNAGVDPTADGIPCV